MLFFSRKILHHPLGCLGTRHFAKLPRVGVNVREVVHEQPAAVSVALPPALESLQAVLVPVAVALADAAGADRLAAVVAADAGAAAV